MADPLMQIPGLAGYLAATQRNQGQGMQQLQQAQAVMGIQDAMQKRAKEQEYLSAVGALGENPSTEALSGVVARFNPEKGLEIRQRAEEKNTAAADRKAAAEQSALQFSMNLDLRREALEQQRDLSLQRATDKATQDAINNDFKARQLVLDEQNKRFQQYLAQQGFDLKKLIAENKPEKPITEFQGKNALYGSRAAMSDRTLNDLEEKISLVGLATKESLQNTPLIGGALGAAANKALSADQQKVEQAQRNFVNAVLRQESGAVISAQEFDNAKKQYFPQPGDSKEVIAQKKANRQMAISGFKRIAGPAWASVEEELKQSAIPTSPAAAGNVPPPPPGFQVNR
jgi:hypothetical protein